MTYLELTKLLGQTDLFICLMSELGYKGEEIAEKLQITEPTVYNAKKRLRVLTDNVMTGNEVIKVDLRNQDIESIVTTFKETFGTTSISRFDRFAAKRLSDKHGADNIVKVIKLLSQHSGDAYVPSVNSVRQIETKWVNIANFFNKLKSQQAIEL